MSKSYFTKIYQPNGDYIDTLKDVNFSGFRKQINGGLGELSFSIPKKFDDFDENYLIKLNNRIDLWVNDDNTGTDGLKIYSGFISRYEPYIQEHEEGVTVRCLGYVSKLATSILKNGTQIELKTDISSGLTTGSTASACEVSDIVKAIIDRFQIETNNPVVDYSSIDDSGNEMTYTFNAKYYLEAIDKCREFAPANHWFYIGADNILQFKPKPSKATHIFVFGKHFKGVKVEKNMENVVNKVLFSSGDNSDQQILKLYEDTDSVNSFDDRWKIITDNRVSVSETADNMGQGTITEKKDAEVKVVVEILDNNGTGTGYDIESINPGDTCKFVGFNDITSLTFTDNMHILGVEYTPNSVILEIENLNPSIARENWENKRKIAEQEATGRASSYDTDTGTGSSNVLGYAQVTTEQTNITSMVDLTDLVVTVTVPSGDKKIRISGYCTFMSSNFPAEIGLNIYEGVTPLYAAYVTPSTAGYFNVCKAEVVLSPSAGTHIYKLAAILATGAGSATMKCSNTYPAFILVELL